MLDVPQSLANLLAALANNVTGDITPAVVRSALLSMFSSGNGYLQVGSWSPVTDAFSSPTTFDIGVMDQAGDPTIPLTDVSNDHYWEAPAAGLYACEAYFEKLVVDVGSSGRTPSHLLFGFQVDNDDFWYERHELTNNEGRYVARNVRFHGLVHHSGSGDGYIRVKVQIDGTGGADPITLTPDGVARVFIERVQ